MGELVSSPWLPHLLLQSDQNLSVLPCCRIYYSQIRTCQFSLAAASTTVRSERPCQFSLAAASTTVRSELVSSPLLPHLLQHDEQDCPNRCCLCPTRHQCKLRNK